MDMDYLLALQRFREQTNGALDGVISLITKLGEPAILLVLGGVFFWCVNRRTGLFLLLGFGASAFVNSLLKVTFCVYRPWLLDARIAPVPSALKKATGYSFPSGHTANAVTLFGGLSISYSKNKWLRALMLAGILAVGFSRNYLGVHTPQDVLVSLLATALALLLLNRLLSAVENNKVSDVAVLAVGLVLSAGLLLYTVMKPYPMDYVDGALLVDPAKMVVDTFMTVGMCVGLLAGFFVERRVVNASTGGTLPVRFVRGAVGIAGMLGLYKLLPPLLYSLLGERWGSLVGSALLLFVMVALYPMLYTAVEKKISARQSMQSAA